MRRSGALETRLDRRQLVTRLSVSALFLGAHGIGAGGPLTAGDGPVLEPRAGAGDDPRILALRLRTSAPLAEMRAFYGELLGLPVLEAGERELVVAAGRTEIAFVRASPDEGAPFYHFAFNIPENKILAARAWQLERTPLFITPESLRDPAYPDDVRHFRSWNAHSVFFWDPAGNVLEYIARHDLANGAGGPFDRRDILYASEIAFVVDEVRAAAAALQDGLGLPQYRNGSDVFWATGDERGLLLVFERGRQIGDGLRGRPAPADVFATRAVIRGSGSAGGAFRGYPYEIGVRP